jgi:hypothetical protein
MLGNQIFVFEFFYVKETGTGNDIPCKNTEAADIDTEGFGFVQRGGLSGVVGEDHNNGGTRSLVKNTNDGGGGIKKEGWPCGHPLRPNKPPNLVYRVIL